MKKIITCMAAMALAISLCGTTALAAGNNRGRYCIDANKDGVCDYHKTACQFVDKNKDGICDHCITKVSKNNVKVQKGCHRVHGGHHGGHHR